MAKWAAEDIICRYLAYHLMIAPLSGRDGPRAWAVAAVAAFGEAGLLPRD
jgi:hypothetical protein